MMIVYKREMGCWNKVGTISDRDTVKEISTEIRKLESPYLFNHHDYMVEPYTGDWKMYFTDGKIDQF
ncbi:hypothetical protein [Levilactobacillus brevis]|uniref:hypothetical protein n=1 Tax=Levilactobacillus brevis TaxID=1580 RepID=UPI0020735C29|nr:hypothetical protein [Levilactobacillus brevis]MDN6763831.1 hypothetical protein [Lactiplantibacillus plantarum]MDN6789692.1 hypothetical protein [Lactiplantibacillus plantarum]